MGPRNVPWECHRAYPIKESKVLLVERRNSMLADLNAARVTDLIVPHKVLLASNFFSIESPSFP
jgi:hypothetical protein